MNNFINIIPIFILPIISGIVILYYKYFIKADEELDEIKRSVELVKSINKINEAREKIGIDPINPKNERPTNCKNCGAPLIGDKCEYCGTEYLSDNSVLIDIKMSSKVFEEIETAPPLTADRYNL